MNFWIINLCLFLTSQAAFAGFSYPFHANLENRYEQLEALAYNEGPATVSAVINIVGTNCISDAVSPINIVVKPHETVSFAHLRSSSPEAPCQSSISSSFQPGDFSKAMDGAPFRLPFEDGKEFTVGQAFGGVMTTHNTPETMHALDINMPEGTKVVAARDGVVVDYEFGNSNSGGKEEWLKTKTNYVHIEHSDGSISEYAHLAPIVVPISEGMFVQAGQVIGYSGRTGYSSGPHLHFAVMKPYIKDDGLVSLRAIPFSLYAYQPQIVFEPKQGMLLEANYSSGPKQWVAISPPQGQPLSDRRQTDSIQPPIDIPKLQNFPVTKNEIPWKWILGLFVAWQLIATVIRIRAEVRQNKINKMRLLENPAENIVPRFSFHSLVTACSGDIEKAERLIEYEISKEPKITRLEAITRATERLSDDRK